jgi:hypothetical protein
MRLLAAMLLLTSCATGTAPRDSQAPWRDAPLRRADVPAVFVTQWEKAENRATCALIAPRSLGDGAGATPRAAQFGGGWGVAYDLPNIRSAFGVAGAGVTADDPTYDKWPYVLTWDDGSRAEYGPEGGQGPNQLAYVTIRGQRCLYNVWSRLGRAHLEYLLRELRLVE